MARSRRKRTSFTDRRRRPARVRAPTRPRAAGDPSWASLPEDELLELRLCDLDLRIEGTILEKHVDRLYHELDAHLLVFRPHVWLSSEFFVADGVPGIAIPFYLAHPRLVKLEADRMLEAEGATTDWCLRILRHEAGHAIDNAYQFHRRRQWREVFGDFRQPYPDYYQPKPNSRRFVLHLQSWYAQSHPSEDFAETFAVWLTPGSDWRRRYRGWPALRKLEYIDELMREVGDTPPSVRSRAEVEPVRRLKMTLREHYEEKLARYGIDLPEFYDRDLRRLFSDGPQYAGRESAADFLRRIRPEIRKLVARWTGEYQYRVDQVLAEMIDRCRRLKLRTDRPDAQGKIEAALLLAVETMKYLHSGRSWLAV